MNEAKVEVRIQYKDVTQGIFKDIARNELVIRIQPVESIYLKLNSKVPGLNTRTVPIEMDLTYKRRFSESHIPEAYESLILDSLRGDHSNFVRDDELDVAWRVSVCLVSNPNRISTFRHTDLHANPPLDRGQEWPISEAATVPIRLARTERTGRVRS